MNMLTANVIGHIGKDAETKTIGERQFISFRMASTARRKDGDKTTWVSVMYRFNDKLLPYLRKGQQVYVQGDMDISTYTNKEGVQQVDVSLFANQLVLLGQRDAQPEQPSQPAPARQPAPQQQSDLFREPSDLPFD